VRTEAAGWPYPVHCTLTKLQNSSVMKKASGNTYICAPRNQQPANLKKKPSELLARDGAKMTAHIDTRFGCCVMPSRNYKNIG